jgi:hypothetical protein
MKNKKTTSERISSLAGKILANPNSSAIAKRLAGSALAQADDKSETGKALEQLAAKVLASAKYNIDTKELAGSVLAQANKER